MNHLLRGSSQLSAYATPLPATGINILEAVPRLNDVQVPKISIQGANNPSGQQIIAQPMEDAMTKLRSINSKMIDKPVNNNADAKY